jgi:uncharacterized caspase-like protein
MTRTFLLLVLSGATAMGQTGGPGRDLRYEATAGRKIALLAGNEAYAKWPLRNPVNDARAMQQVLGELGFQTEVVLNTGLRGLEKSVDAFVARIQPGDIALFYYAGHGIQLDGENYLVPVDFDAKDEADAKYVSYSASRLQERMDRAGARLSLLVLDACRNNPFRAGSRSVGGSGGLAVMNSGKGTLIAFATAPGKTADDNKEGSNGLFTAHLVRALREPGLSLDQVFNRVRERVYSESGERQLPWTVSSVIGEFYFRGVTAPAAPAPVAVAAPVQSLDAALTALTRTPSPSADGGAEALRARAVALFDGGQYGEFEAAALAALRAGAELGFFLGHHHTLTGIHGSALRLTASRLTYDDLGNGKVCNQKGLTVELAAVAALQVVRSPRQEIFLQAKLSGADGKVRTFHFADGTSTVDTSDGVPRVVSPARAEPALRAIANVVAALRPSR